MSPAQTKSIAEALVSGKRQKPGHSKPFAVYRQTLYNALVIRSFRSWDAEALLRHLRPSKALRGFAKPALRRLQQLDSATSLRDLALPGNRLEKLHGDRSGQYSIRINNQWRICFDWREVDAYDVEIVDYH